MKTMPIERPTRFREQFARPTGFLGRIAAGMMGMFNGPMNRLAVDLLDVRPDDRVLEIGCGDGKALGHAAERATGGFVAGIDYSDLMAARAAKRNRAMIARGRVQVRQGTVSHLPFPDSDFVKVLAVNSFYFWPDPEADLREVCRVLRDGGTLLIAVRKRDPAARTDVAISLTDDDLHAIEATARRAGFAAVRTEVRRAKGEKGQLVAAIIATR